MAEMACHRPQLVGSRVARSCLVVLISDLKISRPGDASASNPAKPQIRIRFPSRRKLNQNTEVQRGWNQMRHRVDKIQTEMRATTHERAENSVCTRTRVRGA